jgi:hypothetical protein
MYMYIYIISINRTTLSLASSAFARAPLSLSFCLSIAIEIGKRDRVLHLYVMFVLPYSVKEMNECAGKKSESEQANARTKKKTDTKRRWRK